MIIFISLICLVLSEYIDSTKVYITYAVKDEYYLKAGVNYLKVENSFDYNLTAGYAMVSYNLTSNGVILSKYKRIQENRDFLRQTDSIPVLFDKKLRAKFIRNIVGLDVCLSKESVIEMLKLLSSSMKLMTGYRTEYDIENSYVSLKCVDTRSIKRDDYAKFIEEGTKQAEKDDPSLKGKLFSTNCFLLNTGISSDYGFIGSLDKFSENDGESSLVKLTFLSSSNFFSFAHNIGHNMGFEHSSIAPSSTGFIKKYGFEDSQTGSMSYMGGELANKFHFIPSPSHFRRVVCKRKLYMPWLRSADRGVNTYRLFAWDHPYSRVFLGDDKRKIHQEDDFIDGITFKYNTMGLSLEYGMKTFNSKFKSLLVGRIGLHYRWYPENQDGYQNKGVIFEIDDFVDNTTTIGNYGVILSASTDDIENKDQSYIPLNYVKIPEVDIGTLKFRVTKFHPIKNVIPHLEQLDRMPENVSIDDLPYVEIEVTNLPKE